MNDLTSTFPREFDSRKSAAEIIESGSALINRSYLSELSQCEIRSYSDSGAPFCRATDVRIFRIERIVQNNKRSVLESATAAYTALGAAGYSVFLFLRSDGQQTDVFIGTKGKAGEALGQNSGELLQETFKGHFSGSSLLAQNGGKVNALIDGFLREKDNPSASITAVTGVPALSTDDREGFVQGLERFIDAAERREYQAIILAEPISSKNLDVIRSGYEQVSTLLSPLCRQQLSFGRQESDSVGLSISQSITESLGYSLGLTETRGDSFTCGASSTDTTATSNSSTKQSSLSKGIAAVGPLIGLIGGGPVGGVVGSQIGSAVAQIFSKQITQSESFSHSEGQSESYGRSYGESVSKTNSSTKTSGSTDSRSLSRSIGENQQVSIELVDKGVEQLLDRIDHHLSRINEAKTYGGWNSAAYFIGDSTASSEALASIFLGLVRGNDSCHEDFALTTWNSRKKTEILDWLGSFSHPQLQHNFSSGVPVTSLTPAALVSGKEMALLLSLPRRSTSTVSVVETRAFGRKVQRLDDEPNKPDEDCNLILGHVRHLWENLPQKISLGLDQLASHVFVSGSTGVGKSNALYGLLNQIDEVGIPFMVIEPAKGEYKNVFGQRKNVRVLGTNPVYGELLRINPFRFPSGVHVLEHVDRLSEIFNVCWPMYAAMPAVLKDAILVSYERCGWDMDLSVNRYSDDFFPSFCDLLTALEFVIDRSAYSQELKGNYLGSLATRVRSLTNGLNGQIFSPCALVGEELFDKSVIVDLSRVGSAETKSLIMGLLVMQLSEYRMAKGGMNESLRHVTVIEEAHNILRNSSVESGGESGGVLKKSVEMLTNAIAEMRTYGEGFIIADQSPHAVDISAIRNTNTKIVMRLPDEADRRLIGKSATLNDDQLEEIARLPRGVAVVYQNDWLEPVLCKVDKFSGSVRPYEQVASIADGVSRIRFNRQVVNMLLADRVSENVEIDWGLLRKGVCELPLPIDVKISIYENLGFEVRQKSRRAWKKEFSQTATLLVDVLGCRTRVQDEIQSAESYEQLRERLDSVLMDCAGDVSETLSISAQQCLMKDYSLQSEGNIEIYAAWRASLNAKRLI